MITQAENMQNMQAHNKHGLPRGVRRQEQSGRVYFYAQVTTAKHGHLHLGCFRTVDEADAAVRAWRAANMPYSEDGDRISRA